MLGATCKHTAYLESPYDPLHNPTGIIELSYGENRLLFDEEMIKSLDRYRRGQEHLRYQKHAHGSVSLRKAFVRYLEALDSELFSTRPLSELQTPDLGKSRVRTEVHRHVQLQASTLPLGIDHDSIVMVSGCLSAVAVALEAAGAKGPGVGVIVPSPSSVGHEKPLRWLGLELLATKAITSPSKTLDVIRETFDRAVSCGVAPRAVLLCNPHNPLNFIYPPEDVNAIAEFCEARQMALVVDEVAAPNVFEGRTFVSALRSVGPKTIDPSRLFIATGISKLGLAGWKVGAVCNRDHRTLARARDLAHAHQISSDTQHLVANMLSDGPFVKGLLRRNRSQLAKAYKGACRVLRDTLGAKIVGDGECGLALMFHLNGSEATNTGLLGQDGGSEDFMERQLKSTIFDSAKVIVDRGRPHRVTGGPTLRMVFSAPEAEVNEAVFRMATLFMGSSTTRLLYGDSKLQPQRMLSEAEGLLRHAWERSDTVFGFLRDEAAYYSRPLRLRHPFLFYLGHLPAFAWNQIGRAALGLKSFGSFDDLFERGIDPDVSTGECHPHSAPEDDAFEWPGVNAVKKYRDLVRESVIRALPSLLRIDSTLNLIDGTRAVKGAMAGVHVVEMVVEHELMHVETLLYMISQLSPELKKEPSPEDLLETSNDRPGRDFAFLEDSYERFSHSLVTVSSGDVTLGTHFEGRVKFGWDCEYPSWTTHVNPFDIGQFPVTNKDFLSFVDDGGYDRRELWDDDDWDWLRREGVRHPLSWQRVRSGGQEHAWLVKTPAALVLLERMLFCPVYVSMAEAKAYARWLGPGFRLPTEAEWVRAVYGGENGPTLEGWRPTPRDGNFDFQNWRSTPVFKYMAREGGSAWGVFDAIGNGWEWTATAFKGHPGYVANIPTYPGYSSDFFDGKHFVLLGASWATDRHLVRRSFRNWYRAQYQPVFAKFRVCRDAATNNDTDSPRLAAGLTVVGGFQDLGKKFMADVIRGLADYPKRLPSVYFYDDVGSRIFSAICDTPEYYLCRIEKGILRRHARDIIAASLVRYRAISSSQPEARPQGLDVIELGAGDGQKTAVLLRALLDHPETRAHSRYLPIDISAGALDTLAASLAQSVPELFQTNHDGEQKIRLLLGDNIQGMRWADKTGSRCKLVLFLGSSIGNINKSHVADFLIALRDCMAPGDLLLVGFDLKKEGYRVAQAYNDAAGRTAEFNLNLIDRIRKELNSDLDRSAFEFHSSYDPCNGVVNSYLISRRDQLMSIMDRSHYFSFSKGEAVHTERSCKFDLCEIERFASSSGFLVVQHFMDSDQDFSDTLLRAV